LSLWLKRSCRDPALTAQTHPPRGRRGSTARRPFRAGRALNHASTLQLGPYISDIPLHLVPWTSSTPAPSMPSWRQHRDGWRGPRLANRRRLRPACRLGGWKGPHPASWTRRSCVSKRVLAAARTEKAGEAGGETGGEGSAWCTPGCQRATRGVGH
ncbi:unnamed protein product, partial [Laminaria digitata]